MDLFQAFVLGLVQGITAWIPVSSKTQVLLAGTAFFSLPALELLKFALFLHLGDLTATLYLFRKDLREFYANKKELLALKEGESSNVFNFLIVSFIASAVIAFPLYYLITKKILLQVSGTPLLALLGIFLMVTGLIMYKAREMGLRKEREASIFDALITGVAQGLSVLPGISRSGMTESSLFLRKFDAESALRLSFIMSIPFLIASLAGFFLLEGLPKVGIAELAVGVVASFIASFLTMKFMLDLSKKIGFYWFALALGILGLTPLAYEVFLKLIS